jgi:hypothetical protein
MAAFSVSWSEISGLECGFFQPPGKVPLHFAFPQVSLQEQLTAENFAPDFPLTWEPQGNKIQLPKFLTVAMPSKMILPLTSPW